MLHLGSGFKILRVVIFDGESDPREFVMSFEVAVESAGRDDNTLAKAFVLAVKGISRSWYSVLPPGSIYSWEQLCDALFCNF